MAKIRNRNKYEKSKSSWGFYSLSAFILFIPLLYLFRSPDLQKLRDSLFFNIAIKIVFSCAILCPTWFHKSKPKIGGQILLSLCALSIWVKMIVPTARLWWIIIFILFCGLVLYLCIDYFTNKKVNPIVRFVSLIFLLLELTIMSQYKFVDRPNAIHFWKLSLVISVIITIVFIILLFKNVITLETPKNIGDIILSCIICLLAVFTLVVSAAYNLNHFLDKSEPTLEWAEITDRYIYHSRRHRDYTFRLSLNGKEFDFEVSDTEYYNYEVGEKFPLKFYEGAFDDAYYISGNTK